MDLIAERTLTAVNADGTRFDVTLRLGAPRPSGPDWECAVSVTHFIDKPQAIFGIDAWQALTLALGLVEQLMASFVERGGRLFLHGTDEAVEVASLFGRS